MVSYHPFLPHTTWLIVRATLPKSTGSCRFEPQIGLALTSPALNPILNTPRSKASKKPSPWWCELLGSKRKTLGRTARILAATSTPSRS